MQLVNKSISWDGEGIGRRAVRKPMGCDKESLKAKNDMCTRKARKGICSLLPVNK